MDDATSWSLLAFRLILLMTVARTVASSSALSYDYLECTYNRYRADCVGSKVIPLYATRRGLTEFPAEDIKKIRYNCVKLNNNNILKFPENTKYLDSIQSLDASYNQIDALPADLHLLTELEILDLSHNRIKKLSPHTHFPESLRGLLLSGNELATLPEGLMIPGLFVLDLSHNLFKEIPQHFCVSKQLIRVDFTDNLLNSDLSTYMSTIDKCRNANEVPFCFFTDQEDFNCDCYSLAPLLGQKQPFCLGTRHRGREMKCSTEHSEAKYKNKKIFDVNSTTIKDVCSFALQTKGVDKLASGAVIKIPRLLLYAAVVLVVRFTAGCL